MDSLWRVAGCAFDLAIVDNASDDGSLDVILGYLRGKPGREVCTDYVIWREAKLPVVTFKVSRRDVGLKDFVVHVVAADRNYGFPGGCNIGLKIAREAGAEYALFLNNDTIVDSNFLLPLVAIADEDLNIGLAGSKVYFHEPPNVVQTAGVRIRWLLGRFDNFGDEPDHGQFDVPGDRDAVYATSMLVRLSMVQNIGALDETFVFGIEEYDFCARARKAGYRVVYVPDSRVWHKGGRSAAKLATRPEAFSAIRASRGFLGFRYQATLFRKHLPFPIFVVPILFRTASMLISFTGVVALVIVGKISLSGTPKVGGVDRLHRMDVEDFLARFLPSLRVGRRPPLKPPREPGHATNPSDASKQAGH